MQSPLADFVCPQESRGCVRLVVDSSSGKGERNNTQPTVLKDGYSSRWLGRFLLSMDEARRTPPRFFKVATESECSVYEFWIMEDDVCIDTGVFQRR